MSEFYTVYTEYKIDGDRYNVYYYISKREKRISEEYYISAYESFKNY